MSTFLKPTPTKSRTTRSSTPTKSESNTTVSSGSSSGIKQSSSAQVVEGINLLLHLEAIKRNRDIEIMLRQKVEEAYKLFEERRHKYLNLVANYAALIIHANTREVLLRNDLIDFPTESAGACAINIKEKLSSSSATDFINTKELINFKKLLNNMEKYENLPLKRSELVDLHDATNAIQHSIEAIEMILEKCIPQCLDYFTDTLDMVNYPKLSSENEHI